jgi:hypothetical protein
VGGVRLEVRSSWSIYDIPILPGVALYAKLLLKGPFGTIWDDIRGLNRAATARLTTQCLLTPTTSYFMRRKFAINVVRRWPADPERWMIIVLVLTDGFGVDTVPKHYFRTTLRSMRTATGHISAEYVASSSQSRRWTSIYAENIYGGDVRYRPAM